MAHGWYKGCLGSSTWQVPEFGRYWQFIVSTHIGYSRTLYVSRIYTHNKCSWKHCGCECWVWDLCILKRSLKAGWLSLTQQTGGPCNTGFKFFSSSSTSVNGRWRVTQRPPFSLTLCCIRIIALESLSCFQSAHTRTHNTVHVINNMAVLRNWHTALWGPVITESLLQF